MAITDLFSSSFLFSIAIVVILIGGIFAYVNYRMSEQDHKLTSMVNLVSVLAQEVSFLKHKINNIETNDNNNDNDNDEKLEYSTQLIQPQLISVSDDEEDDDNEYEDDEDDEDIDESVDEDETDDDLEDTEVKKLIIIKDEPNEHDENIKTITLTLDADTEAQDQEFIQLEEIVNEVANNEELTNNEEHNNIDASINISEEPINEEQNVNDENDYKKMDISTLRELVVSRGLTQDASKLKKKDILKMLEK